MRKRQHYVPRFYLKHFRSSEGRINIYNIQRRKIIEEGGLRGQCREDYMYGETEEVEEMLSKFEDDVAPVIRKSVLRKGEIPGGNEEVSDLVTFISLQMVRTKEKEEEVNEVIDSLCKKLYENHPDLESLDFDKYEIRHEHAVMFSMSSALEVGKAIYDLSYEVVESGSKEEFITSDNPVFRYNQYKEGIPECSGIGVIESGIQIFVPFSPDYAVVGYDPNVYSFDGERRGATKILSSDTRELNKMQAVNAGENLYFSSRDMGTSVRKAFESVASKREEKGVQATEFEKEDDENRRLIRQRPKLPNLNFDLSFLHVQPSARRVPLEDRRDSNRKPPPSPPPEWENPDPPPPEAEGRYHRLD